ncbi:IS30 family transposase [Candidatus Spongiihabitans sp.]|uniref:IS30 family transposase n=1 Tax=Candidatus Spongiihabitans sp. TaxID=3101308 RepID=UPI003C6F5881
MVGNPAPIKHQVLTLTSDYGSEFTDHEAVAGVLKSDFHFAHPCAPWQRGANENTNGLIRQRFPKTNDLATIKTSQLARVVRNSTTDHANVLD